MSQLANDDGLFLSSIGDEMNLSSANTYATGSLNELMKSPLLSQGSEIKRRLLLACFVLDQQHALLFGRRRTSCSHGRPMDFYLPKSQVDWDSASAPTNDWAKDDTTDRIWQAVDRKTLADSHQEPYDAFQSMVLLACILYPEPDSNAWDCETGMSRLQPMLRNSPALQLTYETFMLCHHTVVRDLLGVVGESWIMAEKMCSEADFTMSQIECRHWALTVTGKDVSGIPEEQSSIEHAAAHALQILAIHRAHPKTGLIFQEWAVYLSAIVIWAKAYASPAAAEDRKKRVTSNSTLAELSPLEIELTVGAYISAGSDRPPTMADAMAILAWVKSGIERVDIPHNCGLLNGAVDVLGRLLVRGEDERWF